MAGSVLDIGKMHARPVRLFQIRVFFVYPGELRQFFVGDTLPAGAGFKFQVRAKRSLEAVTQAAVFRQRFSVENHRFQIMHKDRLGLPGRYRPEHHYPSVPPRVAHRRSLVQRVHGQVLNFGEITEHAGDGIEAVSVGIALDANAEDAVTGQSGQRADILPEGGS